MNTKIRPSFVMIGLKTKTKTKLILNHNFIRRIDLKNESQWSHPPSKLPEIFTCFFAGHVLPYPIHRVIGIAYKYFDHLSHYCWAILCYLSTTAGWSSLHQEQSLFNLFDRWICPTTMYDFHNSTDINTSYLHFV